MKKHRFRIYSVFSVISMFLILALLTGCSEDKPKQGVETSLPAMKTHKISNTGLRTVVDQNGRLVKLPSEINRIVTVPLPLPSLYFVLNGSCEKIVGIHPSTKNRLEFSMMGVLAPELMKASTDFIKGGDVNIEALLQLRPDIVFFWGLNTKQLKVFEAIDIPAVAVYTIDGANVLDNLHLWMNLFEQIFGKSETSTELISDNYKTLEMIQSKIRDLPQEKKPRVLVLYYHNAKQIGVYGKNSYNHYWVTSTGGINVSDEYKNMADVNMEQIYKWNPDIIYISNFSNTTPDDFYNNNIENQDWREVKAVKERKVFKIPSGVYRWYPPNTDASLMLKWMAQIHHPGLFSDYDIKEEIKHHYLRFYHYALSDEQVNNILHPVKSTRMTE